MNLYRDRVGLGPEKILTRAKVSILSAAEYSLNNGMQPTGRTAVVLVPAATKFAEEYTELWWRDERYQITDRAEPVTAMGRLDHYSITCERILG